MPGLDPGIAIFAKKSLLAMDCRVKPGNDGCASSRHMRRYREPFPVLLRPALDHERTGDF
jgi:hypothetical protein